MQIQIQYEQQDFNYFSVFFSQRGNELNEVQLSKIYEKAKIKFLMPSDACLDYDIQHEYDMSQSFTVYDTCTKSTFLQRTEKSFAKSLLQCKKL